MKTIYKYVAKDGREFNAENTCASYEAQLVSAEEIMARLRPCDGDTLRSGRAFLQQDPVLVHEVKCAILALHLGDAEHIARAKIAPPSHSFIGRIFDDSDSPLRAAWFRLMCIDEKGREWEQPYFANNPQEGAKEL